MSDANIARSLIEIDYTNVLAGAIGDKHGLTEADMDIARKRTADIHKWLTDLRKNQTIGFFDLPSQNTKEIKKYASRVREKYDNFVVLGIGGSALGTAAVHSALNHSFHHLLTKRKRNGYPRLFVADNIDPDWFSDLLSVVPPEKTLFNVISKSGSTAETMSQFMIVFNHLKQRLKGKWKKKVLITTDVKKGVLREIVNENKLPSFSVPDNVGGRFSVFTPVGLVPLACAGVDIDGLLEGASAMAELCSSPDMDKNPAYLFGAIHYLADVKKGKNISVMMPYSNKLYLCADWYRQMWAESLGKKNATDGTVINCGQTPVKALGATDQHSQVQLYVEGPFDKITTFIDVKDHGRKTEIPAVFADKPSLNYLAGKSLNRLLSTEMRGTEYALTSHNRPNLTITLPSVTPQSIGAFIFLLEAATAYAGGLYGIDPFDQPGVEFGKDYTYAMLGREGYEGLKAEIEVKSASGKRRTV